MGQLRASNPIDIQKLAVILTKHRATLLVLQYRLPGALFEWKPVLHRTLEDQLLTGRIGNLF